MPSRHDQQHHHGSITQRRRASTHHAPKNGDNGNSKVCEVLVEAGKGEQAAHPAVGPPVWHLR